MYLILIAAIGKNHELGFQGDMPWKRSLKEDLAFFREQTMGHTIVMGRKTFESLGAPLPGRHHVVLSSRSVPGVESYQSWQEFEEAYKDHPNPIFLIGGASLYKQFLNQADELLLTEIEDTFQADCFFPSFNPADYEKTILGRSRQKDPSYKWVRYLLKKPEKQSTSKDHS